MDNKELLRLFQDHSVEAPKGATDVGVDLIKEEVEEKIPS